jgi:hypothetical protein
LGGRTREAKTVDIENGALDAAAKEVCQAYEDGGQRDVDRS